MVKIGFFGTPEIASNCLEGLLHNYEVSFLVSAPDKPSGRHQKMTMCAAKNVARCQDIDILQPASLKDPDFVKKIKSYKADIYVVVAYGKIIPREIFDYPPLKTINLHPSLLPKYRGAAPIPWVLINGESETGVTVQLINEQMDAGDIVVQEKISLDSEITTGELYDIILPMGAELIDRAIKLLASGDARPVKQKEDEATFCGKITRETGQIDWTGNSTDIHNLVRGLNPKPAAWTTFREKNMKIWKTAVPADDPGLTLKPGELARFQKKRLFVGTGNGCLEIFSLQPETKKVMDGQSFINGYRPEPGESFDV